MFITVVNCNQFIEIEGGKMEMNIFNFQQGYYLKLAVGNRKQMFQIYKKINMAAVMVWQAINWQNL